MKILFNKWVCLFLFLVIISWVIISIKFDNISTMQILISKLFIFIAYILYLVKFIRFKKTVAIIKQV
ncbi:hypothetical protein EON03_07750 [Staphylococcus aureus]|nr:hypothetical protein B7473_07760 [Staphylococcus aureus]AUJ56368.1 hypothetical protein B7474_02975 [Staphylococcus aureus]AUW99341.1 hypothetical protein B7R57_09435 [Staphylococcus aureus]AVS41827.1 hypothetical protein C9J90_10925 [Staphylococcus aureus]AWR26786.1 hypothetical protein B9Y35_09505 [Staphylococcus aureus]